jgi:hypothetical protein
MDMPVDEAGCDDETICVYDQLPIQRPFRHRLDLAAPDFDMSYRF